MIEICNWVISNSRGSNPCVCARRSRARGRAVTGPIRVGVACDYREELWPSMDLVAEMILAALARRPADEVLADAALYAATATALPAVNRAVVPR